MAAFFCCCVIIGFVAQMMRRQRMRNELAVYQNHIIMRPGEQPGQAPPSYIPPQQFPNNQYYGNPAPNNPQFGYGGQYQQPGQMYPPNQPQFAGPGGANYVPSSQPSQRPLHPAFPTAQPKDHVHNQTQGYMPLRDSDNKQYNHVDRID
eukprot:CAMPEP_0168335068 /NCGR_PEP_ID=MMETSP0213-20121227/10679_1 /TAXON_ID=151035 /ORGANISM="Euplotes harpa, Strain FSP1.4" /LENGTH=148 /DNA_ID=CAMNT_0008339905 /DNA_START=115 /DNA_END=561 /DNA_ORIENTATION=+